MEIDWIASASRLESPNADERPADSVIDLLVIHSIALPPGRYGNNYVEQFFLNKLDFDAHPYFQEIIGIKVSSHLYIKRCGQIIQFVPFSKRAWHAGVSSWQGRSACNDFSIGIELEGCDDQAFTEKQYQSLVSVTSTLIANFPEVTANRIVGHSDIAPDRKTDPGPCFDWSRYLENIYV